MDVIKVPGPSASPAFSNLACVGGGGLAYAHKRQVVVLFPAPAAVAGGAGAAGGGAASEARVLDVPGATAIHSVCASGGVSGSSGNSSSGAASSSALLAAGTDAGLFVWADGGARPLFAWQLPSSDEDSWGVANDGGGGSEITSSTSSNSGGSVTSGRFVRGLAFNAGGGAAHLLAGTSGGRVAVFDLATCCHHSGSSSSRNRKGSGRADAEATNDPSDFVFAAPVGWIPSNRESMGGGVGAGGASQTTAAAAVTAVGTAHQSRGGAADAADGGGREVVVCDDAGTLTVWRPRPLQQQRQRAGARNSSGSGSASNSCPYELVAAGEIAPNTAGSGAGGAPFATAAGVRKGLVIAGCIDGSVRIYGLADAALRCEIAAHARWCAALALHPRRDAFACAAEDGTVGVWALPSLGDRDAARVVPLLSAVVPCAPLVGVAFIGPNAASVAAAPCDGEGLLVWPAAAAAV